MLQLTKELRRDIGTQKVLTHIVPNIPLTPTLIQWLPCPKFVGLHATVSRKARGIIWQDLCKLRLTPLLLLSKGHAARVQQPPREPMTLTFPIRCSCLLPATCALLEETTFFKSKVTVPSCVSNHSYKMAETLFLVNLIVTLHSFELGHESITEHYVDSLIFTLRLQTQTGEPGGCRKSTAVHSRE